MPAPTHSSRASSGRPANTVSSRKCRLSRIGALRAHSASYPAACWSHWSSTTCCCLARTFHAVVLFHDPQCVREPCTGARGQLVLDTPSNAALQAPLGGKSTITDCVVI